MVRVDAVCADAMQFADTAGDSRPCGAGRFSGGAGCVTKSRCAGESTLLAAADV